MCSQVMWHLHTITWHAIGPKRLMGKCYMGQGQHGEKNITVVWYIIYQLPLRPFAGLKFSPVSFLGEISPKEDPIALKQHNSFFWKKFP